MRLLPIVVASLLPIAAHAECSQRDLEGHWVVMVGFNVVIAEPGQFRVNGDCSVTGERQNGLATSSGRLQADKRGIIGRVSVDDGERFFGGWFVAVKRG